MPKVAVKTNLAPDHHDHLQKEGFTNTQITILEAQGVRTIEASEAKGLGFVVYDKNNVPHSGRGILFPFTPTFGQVRFDIAPINKKGKPCKYLTALGARSQARSPDGCVAYTEGYKDGERATMSGGIVTGSMAGVSHYRKTLTEGSGKTVVFDSDGWLNPQVFSNLIHAGAYLKGKVALLPAIEGHPKGGMCEWFNSGATSEDYKALLDNAFSPGDLLLEWPRHWAEMSAGKKAHAARVAAGLAALYLKPIQHEALSIEIVATTGYRRSFVLKEIDKRCQVIARRQQHEAIQQHLQQEGLGYRIPEETTVEQFVFEKLFQSGKGTWAVINDTFHEYQGSLGYWENITDQVIGLKVSRFLMACYTDRMIRNIRTIKKQGTDPNLKASISFCRAALQIATDPKGDRLIAFKNATVDVTTGRMEPHGQSNYLTSGVDAEYHPDLDCPAVFSEYIDKCFGADLKEMIQCMLSTLLDPSAPYGNFFHLKGVSGSGKGTLLNLISNIFGKSYRNDNNFSLLNDPDKRHQFLTGAKVFAFGDTSGQIRQAGSFLDLIDNQPSIGRFLRSSDGYIKRWDVRFIVASASYLSIENMADGWERRAIVIPTLPRKGNPDKTMQDRIVEAKAEVISWALGMDRARRNEILANAGEQFEAVQQAQYESSLISDSVRRFIDDCCRPATVEELEQSGEPIDGLSTQELTRYYKSYCLAHDYKPKSQNMFSNFLQSLIPFHYRGSDKYLNVQGKRKRTKVAWVNMYVIHSIFSDGGGDSVGSVSYLCHPERTQPGGVEEFRDWGNRNTDVPVVTMDIESQPEIEVIPTEVATVTTGNESAEYEVF